MRNKFTEKAQYIEKLITSKDFLIALCLFFSALVVRLLYVAFYKYNYIVNVPNDQLDYHIIASYFAHGLAPPIIFNFNGLNLLKSWGTINISQFLQVFKILLANNGKIYFPSFYHAILPAFVLCIEDLIGLTTYRQQLFGQVVIGALVIPVIYAFTKGLVNRQSALFAGIIGVINPGLILFDGSILGEDLAQLLTALVISQTVSTVKSARTRSFVLLGVLIGLATLARSELIILLGLCIIALIISSKKTSLVREINLGKATSTIIMSFLIVVLPWFIYSSSHVGFQNGLSGELGVTLAESNCPRTYYGSNIGYLDATCYGFEEILSQPEQQFNSKATHQALSYVLDHKARFLFIVLVRLGRALGIYSFNTQVSNDMFLDAWAKSWTISFIVSNYILYLFSFGALLILMVRKRFLPFFLLGSLVLEWFLIAMLIYPDGRFSSPSEVALVSLAGFFVNVILDRVRQGFHLRTLSSKKTLTQALGNDAIETKS